MLSESLPHWTFRLALGAFACAGLSAFATPSLAAAPSTPAARAVRVAETQDTAAPERQNPAEGSNEARTVQTPQSKTEDFHLSRERYEKAVAYSRADYTLYFISVAWEVLVLLVVLNTKIVARLRDFAEARTSKWIVQGAIFVPLLFVLLAVVRLPIGIYWHSLSLKYEQSVQGWGSWFWDWTKGEIISVVIGFIAVAILFAVIRKKPKSWWFYFWLVSIPLVVFLVFIAPLVLDPVFNKFRPLGETNPQLVQSIEKLAQRAGEPIPRERIFLMEASAKTNQINAYVTGIGASKRVVVWDNTIKKMTPDEVLFIVGHEMGHYVLGHVVKGIAFALVGIFVGLFLGYHVLQWALRRWGAKWGVRGQDDWAALAVLLLIAGVLGFLSEPIGNGFSRGIEHAADVYGLELIHGIVPNPQQTAAQSFQVMGDLDLADPNPPGIITIWLYSHPPLAERLKFARDYDPWGEGKSPKYVK
jgi:STE24 endopeptidase